VPPSPFGFPIVGESDSWGRDVREEITVVVEAGDRVGDDDVTTSPGGGLMGVRATKLDVELGLGFVGGGGEEL
jgi:hypothetical protein